MVHERRHDSRNPGDDKVQKAGKTRMPAEPERQNGTSQEDAKSRRVPTQQMKLSEELAQYVPPILPRDPPDKRGISSSRFVPVSELAHRKAPEELELQTQQFSLILPLGGVIKRRVLIDLLAEHLNVDTLVAERRIVLGKGILLRDLGYDEARALQTRFRKGGQEVAIVTQRPELEFGPPLEIFAIGLSGAILEVMTSGERIQVLREHVVLIGCGGVRLAPGVLMPKNVMDLFCQDPQYRFRIWETTFNFKSAPFASGVPGEESFFNLATGLATKLPRAKGTPQLIAMIENHLLSPQIFESLEEYDHYNQWVLWNYYGEKV